MSDKPQFLRQSSVPVEYVPPHIGAAAGFPWPELEFVRLAFEGALGHAGEIIDRHVDPAQRVAAEMLVPSLCLAGGVVVGTTAIGATLGGSVGSLAAGVGATSGAVASGLGVNIAMNVLRFTGLQSIVPFVAKNITPAARHYDAGARRAWNSQGEYNEIRAAARSLADGAGVLAGIMVRGVVNLTISNGVDRAANGLGTSWVGNKLVRWMLEHRDYLEGEALIRALMLEVGPRADSKVRQNVMVAMIFFRQAITGLRSGAPAKWASYLEGIDFHSEVRHQILNAGTEVVRYGLPGGRMGNYYTVRGTSADRLGIDADGRVLYRYKLKSAIDTLMCQAAPMRYGKPKFDVLRSSGGEPLGMRNSPFLPGGGLQYVIADKDLPMLEWQNPPDQAKPPT